MFNKSLTNSKKIYIIDGRKYGVDYMKKENAFFKRIKYILPVSLFFVFTVLFYGPLSLYLPNSQELWFGIGTALKITGVISVAVLVLSTAIGAVLPSKLRTVYTKLVFGVSLAFYVQGNFIKMNYGVLDGTDINWGSTKQFVINGVIWAVCIALPFVLGTVIKKIKKSRKNKAPLKITTMKVLMALSLFLVAVQVPAFISQAAGYKPNAQGDLQVTNEREYELAKKDNVIIFLVDTLDEQYYNNFLSRHPDFTKDLDGFVQYDNTTSAGIRTILAVPSMLTGKPYLRENLFSDYLENIWSKENVLSLMKKDGRDVRVFTEPTYFSEKTAGYVDNFNVDSTVGSYRILAVKLYKLTLMKFAPQFLKQYFFVNTSEFGDAKASKNVTDLFTVNDAQFYKSFRKNGFTVSGNYDKAFRFYHLHGAHAPYTLTKNGNAKKNGKTSCKEQVEGTLVSIKEMINQLKEKGLYDSATIVIAADHGDKNKAQWPAFIMKEAGAKGKYSVSKAPVSLFDFPVYMSSLAGGKLPFNKYGKDIKSLKEDTERERTFFVNTSGSSRLAVVEYKTKSTADDFDSVVKVSSHKDPKGINTPYKLGEKLSFGTESTGNRYCTEGFGNNTGFGTKVFGPCAKLTVPIKNLRKSAELKVTLTPLKRHCKNTTLKIKANGQTVFENKLTPELVSGDIVFTIPADVFKKADKNKLNLDLLFTDIPESEMEVPVKERTLVFAIKDLVIEENK